MQHKRATSGRKVNTVTVRRAPGESTQARINFAGQAQPAAIGRSGMTVLKHEGDGATPRGNLRVLYGFWRSDRLARPMTALNLRPVRADMLWCDAPSHAAYNRPVLAPFRASHEKLRRADDVYDVCIVLDWNVSERRRNRGSAIFLHLSRPGHTPTEGCVAVSLPVMKRLLTVLRPGSVLRIL